MLEQTLILLQYHLSCKNTRCSSVVVLHPASIPPQSHYLFPPAAFLDLPLLLSLVQVCFQDRSSHSFWSRSARLSGRLYDVRVDGDHAWLGGRSAERHVWRRDA